jgi:thiol:disulfide interchange protein DsbD
MRLLHTLSLVLLSFGIATAQIQEPTKIEFLSKDLGKGKVELIAKVVMDPGWHIYSVNTPDTSLIMGGEFTFKPNASYRKIGMLQEPEPHCEYDQYYMMDLCSHEGTVLIKQVIEVLSAEDFTIEAEFGFQTCDEEMCLPPDYQEHTYKIKGYAGAAAKTSAASKGMETPPDARKEEPVVSESSNEDTSEVPGEQLEIDYNQHPEEEKAESPSKKENRGVITASDQEEENRSLIGIFILSFLGGFAALLTPCVFPMIPLTVSFFTKQSKTRAKGIANGVTYGLSIIVLYTFLGWAITAAFGPDALNQFSTHPVVNLVFFFILIVFAISFFGAFEITLPSSWVNKVDRASDRGGVFGIFLMALVLALVSFSCTGPIIGGLLFDAFKGGVSGPLVGMFGFSLALALPFALFAAFPGWLNSLPKSGGWLNSVKVVLGFLELGFALKFLSTADLVWQAGILKREWFLVIWIAIGLLLTLYLLGKYRMPHDSPSDKISVFRLFLAIISLSFTIYLVPGLFGAPLKLIAGFPPPDFYSETPGGFNKSTTVHAGGANNDLPEGVHPESCPNGLNCFHDFELGLAYAKEVNKPILLDFTGWGCVNCRKMEGEVWLDPQVDQILRDEVVLISLYVDEFKKLPEEEQYVSEVTGKKIKTIGNKWSDFQIKHFQRNAQPQYILLGHNSMEPLNGWTAYDPDVQLYIDWLREGIAEFEKQ